MRVSEKIVLAVVAAVATLGAAAITILPDLLNRNGAAMSVAEELDKSATSVTAEPSVTGGPGVIDSEAGDAAFPARQDDSPSDQPVSQTIKGDGNVQIGHDSRGNIVTQIGHGSSNNTVGR